MNLWKKIVAIFEANITIKRLVTLVLVLLAVFLTIETQVFWGGTLSMLYGILLPFFIGFMLAFILHPLIVWLEKIHISRTFSVPVLLLLLFAGLLAIGAAVIPTLINDVVSITKAIGGSVEQLYNYYVDMSKNPPSELVSSVVTQIINQLNSTTWTTNLSNTITSIIQSSISQILSVVTFALFTIIVTLYFIFDYEKIAAAIFQIAGMISTKLQKTLQVTSKSISDYLSALFVLMLIKFVEYSIVYTIIGHRYALIIALIMALGLLIPYVGGIFGNIVGILTALNLSTSRVVLLLVFIAVLSNVDAYVISPIVYKRKVQTNPLVSLLVIYGFSAMFGPMGVLIAIPFYISARSIYNLIRNQWIIQDDAVADQQKKESV